MTLIAAHPEAAVPIPPTGEMCMLCGAYVSTRDKISPCLAERRDVIRERKETDEAVLRISQQQLKYILFFTTVRV